MKKNRYFLIAFLVLAAIAAILLLTRHKSTISGPDSRFAVEDTANIVKIFMSDKNNNTLTLSRADSLHWTVDGKYPASTPNLNMLLGTLLNIRVLEPVADAAHNTVIRELAATSVKVEIYQTVYRVDLFGKIRLFPHTKLTKTYYVGGATQDNRGTYMLMEGAQTPYIIYMPDLRGFVSPRYMPIAKYWRDYSIFRKNPAEIRSIKVEIPAAPQESYVLSLDRGNVTITGLADNQLLAPMDTLAVYNFLTGFRKLNFEALLNDMNPAIRDSILASQPYFIITLTDTAGITKSIKAFRKAGTPEQVTVDGKPFPYDVDRLYALVNDGQDFVLAQYFLFDRVLRPKSYFLKKE
jgi:hypothetical protein